MTKKRLVKLPIKDEHNGVETFIPLGIVEGESSGPTLAIVSGIHATEFVSQDGVMRVWCNLEPGDISGTVLFVLGADVKSMFAHSMWRNPIDGKRMGANFPGDKDGTLTDVIAHTIWKEVVENADAVIDCHGGEYSENMTSYVITHAAGDEELDRRTLDLAMALGVPYVEVTRPGGVIGRRGGLTTEAVHSGRLGMVMEIGGAGARDEKSIREVYQALQNAMIHLRIKQGQPLLWAGKPVRLERGIILNTSSAGLWEPSVVNGQWIEKDAVFGRVRDFDGTLLEEVRAPGAGVVITVINARCIEGGEESSHFLQGFAGKIGVIAP